MKKIILVFTLFLSLSAFAEPGGDLPFPTLTEAKAECYSRDSTCLKIYKEQKKEIVKIFNRLQLAYHEACKETKEVYENSFLEMKQQIQEDIKNNCSKKYINVNNEKEVLSFHKKILHVEGILFKGQHMNYISTGYSDRETPYAKRLQKYIEKLEVTRMEYRDAFDIFENNDPYDQ